MKAQQSGIDQAAECGITHPDPAQHKISAILPIAPGQESGKPFGADDT